MSKRKQKKSRDRQSTRALILAGRLNWLLFRHNAGRTSWFVAVIGLLAVLFFGAIRLAQNSTDSEHAEAM